MKTKQYNDVIEQTNVVDAENNIKLSWSIGSGFVCDDNQTGQWCDQSISLVYVKTEIELLAPIWSTVLYHENYIGQRRDQSYRCILRWKWY